MRVPVSDFLEDLIQAIESFTPENVTKNQAQNFDPKDRVNDPYTDGVLFGAQLALITVNQTIQSFKDSMYGREVDNEWNAEQIQYLMHAYQNCIEGFERDKLMVADKMAQRLLVDPKDYGLQHLISYKSIVSKLKAMREFVNDLQSILDGKDLVLEEIEYD